ncbi:hypothetical protein GEMRC1_005690 [Eukaryota sp. GEM-RC1]
MSKASNLLLKAKERCLSVLNRLDDHNYSDSSISSTLDFFLQQPGSIIPALLPQLIRSLSSFPPHARHQRVMLFSQLCPNFSTDLAPFLPQLVSLLLRCFFENDPSTADALSTAMLSLLQHCFPTSQDTNRFDAVFVEPLLSTAFTRLESSPLCYKCLASLLSVVETENFPLDKMVDLLRRLMVILDSGVADVFANPTMIEPFFSILLPINRALEVIKIDGSVELRELFSVSDIDAFVSVYVNCLHEIGELSRKVRKISKFGNVIMQLSESLSYFVENLFFKLSKKESHYQDLKKSLEVVKGLSDLPPQIKSSLSKTLRILSKGTQTAAKPQSKVIESRRTPSKPWKESAKSKNVNQSSAPIEVFIKGTESPVVFSKEETESQLKELEEEESKLELEGLDGEESTVSVTESNYSSNISSKKNVIPEESSLQLDTVQVTNTLQTPSVEVETPVSVQPQVKKSIASALSNIFVKDSHFSFSSEEFSTSPFETEFENVQRQTLEQILDMERQALQKKYKAIQREEATKYIQQYKEAVSKLQNMLVDKLALLESQIQEQLDSEVEIFERDRRSQLEDVMVTNSPLSRRPK